VDEFAQLIVWLLVIAVAIVAVRYGPGGVRQWARAKFLGKLPGE
jgi:hypothetical protein